MNCHLTLASEYCVNVLIYVKLEPSGWNMQMNGQEIPELAPFRSDFYLNWTDGAVQTVFEVINENVMRTLELKVSGDLRRRNPAASRCVPRRHGSRDRRLPIGHAARGRQLFHYQIHFKWRSVENYLVKINLM